MKHIFLFFLLLPFCALGQTENKSLLSDSLEAPYLIDEVTLQKYLPGKGIGLIADDDGYKMIISGFVQPYFENRIITGESKDYYRFRVRRARLRLAGTDASRKLSYRVTAEFGRYHDLSQDYYNVTLYDAFVRYNINRNWRIQIGQKSLASDNRELKMVNTTLQIVERSKLSSTFAAIRDVGLVVEGRIKLYGNQYLRPTFEITSGDGPNAAKNYGGLKYAVRVNYLPFGLFRSMGEFTGTDFYREKSPKLSIGVAYSYIDGVSSARGDRNGNLLYFDEADNMILPIYKKLHIDFLFKYNGFTMLGEYANATADVIDADKIVRRERNGVGSTNFIDAYGENNVEGKVKGYMALGTGINLQAGYLFNNRFSVDVRYTNLNASKFSWLNNNTLYNRPHYFTLGLTKYFTEGNDIKLQSSVTYNKAGNDATFPDSSTPIGEAELTVNLLFSIAF